MDAASAAVLIVPWLGLRERLREGRVTGAPYNAHVSPSRRRRPGDNAPHAASFGLEEASGTAFIDESEDGETGLAAIPEEPAWMREAPADGVADPSRRRTTPGPGSPSGRAERPSRSASSAISTRSKPAR